MQISGSTARSRCPLHQKDALSSGRAVKPGAGVHIPLREPQSRLWRGTPQPGGGTQGLSSRGLALCPQGASWTRVCHSPVHSPGRGESRGPLQVRNQAPETKKPSRADPRRLREAFESQRAAIAGGSYRGCKCGARAGVSSVALAQTSCRETAAGREFLPAAALRRRDAAVRRSGVPCWTSLLAERPTTQPSSAPGLQAPAKFLLD